MGSSSRALRAAFFAVALSAGNALAQQEGPAAIQVDPVMLYPGVDLSYGYDDNLFSSEINKKSSSLLVFSPYLRAEARPGPHRFDATFRYDAGRYGGSRSDDYDDYQLNANALAVFSARSDLRMRAAYVYGHEPRGSTDRPFGDTPDEFVDAGAEASFGYGAPGARGRVEINGGYYDRTYQNNRTFTAESDRDTGFAGGTFLWRVAPKSQLFVQGEQRRIDYDLTTSTLDSDETRFYVGARWDATAHTSGSAKVGSMHKDFDSDTRQDFTEASWEVGVRWSPLTYSVFDFTTSRQTNESTGVGDTIVSSIYNVIWTHTWTSRMRTQVLAGWRNDDFRGVGVTREDDIGTLGLRAYYQIRRWLRFGAEYSFTDRNSTDPIVNYQRNFILLTVGATL